MIAKPAIFISSTGDLHSARDLVAKVLLSMGYEPIWQDIEATTGGELLDILRERVARCEMMIQLVGCRYGAEPPQPIAEFGRVSYTQFEALYAERLGQRVIYHFIETGFPTDSMEAEEEDHRALQEAYRKQIQTANRLRQDHISTTQDLELSIRRINNDLSGLRKQAEKRFSNLVWIVAGIAAGLILVIGLTMAALHGTSGNSKQIATVDARQEEQIANERKIIADQQKIIDALSAKPIAQGQSKPEPPPPELKALANELPKDNPLSRALKASVDGRHEEANRILQELKSKPGNPMDEAFRLATIEGDNWYQAGEPDKAIQPYEQAMALRPNDIRARNNLTLAHGAARLGDIAGHLNRAMDILQGTLQLVPKGSHAWAWAQNDLGNLWREMRSGDRVENLQKAIEAYQKALTVRTKQRNPVDWAETQNNLGVVWGNMPTGNKAENLHKAIEAYQNALTVYTKEVNPIDWAMTQNNLGTAWSEVTTGNREENLHKAIAAYQKAMTVYTREADPRDWAMTQNNIGIAWKNIPSGDRTENLHKAIEAYQNALTVYTREVDPMDWAMTQNNIGIAWKGMPSGDRTENLHKAIEAYQNALTVYTKEADPFDWAMAQNNLGNAWFEMPTGDKAENLQRSIEAYQIAMTVYTKGTDPISWATAQNNLGVAWMEMPTGDKAENLHKAIDAYQAALTVRTKEADPSYWAMTQNNLGAAWFDMPTGGRAENLHKAIDAYEAALTVYTQEADPVHRAMTKLNVGNALADMAELKPEDRVAWLTRAIASDKAALLVLTEASFPHEHASAEKALSTDRKAYEAAGGAKVLPFDAIVPAY